MADSTQQGNVDPSGLTAPGELHLEISPPDGASSAGSLADVAAWPWWLWLAAGVGLWLILKR